MDAIAQTHHATQALRALIEPRARAHGRARRACGAHRRAAALRRSSCRWRAGIWARAGAQRLRAALRNHHELVGRGGLRAGGRRPGFDMGRDLLTARGLLERAGLGSSGPTCWRAAWSKRPGSWPALPLQSLPARARGLGRASAAPSWPRASMRRRWRWRRAVARIAVGVGRRVGLCRRRAARRRPRPWRAGPAGGARRPAGRAVGARRSSAGWPARPSALPLDVAAPARRDPRCTRPRDPSDEAERAAACVLRHVEAGRVPVALAAIDRVLTRRIRAHAGRARRGHPRRDRLEAVHHARGRARDAGACAPARGTRAATR